MLLFLTIRFGEILTEFFFDKIARALDHGRSTFGSRLQSLDLITKPVRARLLSGFLFFVIHAPHSFRAASGLAITSRPAYLLDPAVQAGGPGVVGRTHSSPHRGGLLDKGRCLWKTSGAFRDLGQLINFRPHDLRDR